MAKAKDDNKNADQGGFSDAELEEFQMPEAVGDNHPLADEVKKALYRNLDLPSGISLDFGRGDAWLMDLEDARKFEASRAAGLYRVRQGGVAGFAGGTTGFYEDAGSVGKQADDGDAGNGGSSTRSGRGAGSQAGGGGSSSTATEG